MNYIGDSTTKLRFLGCGKNLQDIDDARLYENTSAFIKAENDGTNMLLIDCGKSVIEANKHTGVLSDVDRLILHITHTHHDHVGGVPELVRLCEDSEIDLSLLDTQMNNARRYRKIMAYHGLDKLKKTSARDAADMLCLRDIQFQSLNHYNQDLKKYDYHTIGLVIDNEIAYLSDHYDPAVMEFFINALRNKTIKQVCTDTTEMPVGYAKGHLPFELLCAICPEWELRSGVTTMHMDGNISTTAKSENFRTADQFLYKRHLPCWPRLPRLASAENYIA